VLVALADAAEQAQRRVAALEEAQALVLAEVELAKTELAIAREALANEVAMRAEASSAP